MNSTLTYRPKSPDTNIGGYRYFFNGQEADNEVLVEGAVLTAEFWQYDSRLGRRWNVDPVFKEYESPFACFAGNPVWFTDPRGDSSVWDNKGYMIHYDPNDKDLRVFIQENGKLRLVGELGKTIEADSWFANLLKDNAATAKDSWNPFGFRNKVKQFGEWDYKRAEDLNNFHFGVVGKVFGLFPETFMLKQAGKAEMEKWADDGMTVPDAWTPKVDIYVSQEGTYPTFYRKTILLPPYGDNPEDHKWIKLGFEYYNNN